jgi:hypothetical protein
MGVLDLGVLGRELPGEAAQLLACELEFSDTELLPINEGEVLLPRDIRDDREVAGNKICGYLF